MELQESSSKCEGKRRFGARPPLFYQTVTEVRTETPSRASDAFAVGDVVLVRPPTGVTAGFRRWNMRNSISRTIVAGVAGLAMAAAVILPTTPASAGGFRMGGGGWHGGGWGGGWHGGGWGGGGWRGGWAGRLAGWAGGRVWHGGYWNNGVWYNGWWGPAVAAGVLAGAALATYPAWGYGGYGTGTAAEAAAGSIGRPMTATATPSARAGSISAEGCVVAAFSQGLARAGPFSFWAWARRRRRSSALERRSSSEARAAGRAANVSRDRRNIALRCCRRRSRSPRPARH